MLTRDTPINVAELHTGMYTHNYGRTAPRTAYYRRKAPYLQGCLQQTPNPQLQLLMKMTSVRFRDWSEPALVVKKTQLKHPVLQRQVFTFIFAILCVVITGNVVRTPLMTLLLLLFGHVLDFSEIL